MTKNWFQIATTVQWKYNCAVLGLAACHVSQNCNEKMQVRPAGQAGYPISLVASLDTVPVKCCVPLQKCKHSKRSFTSVQMSHTHPACSEVWFWKIVAGEVGQKRSKWTYRMLVYKAVVISLRREIRFKLQYLDRIAEAHALDHPPRFIDFPRCHSRRQSIW